MTGTDIDIGHLRQWIGREETRAEQLTPAIADRFNATFDRREACDKGDLAPTLIHLCLAPDVATTSDLATDGHPARGGFLPPVPLPRRMWAGGSFTFLGAIRVGDMVRRRSVIREVALKQGRSGALCFVTVEHRIDCGGKLVITEMQEIVYRESSPAAAAPAPASAAPAGEHRCCVLADPALLFRYSALTFNGHRIHYDRPYVQGVEGYPGLVVHGPLQATLLAQFAETLHGRRLSRFRFRSLSPLFDTQDFTLNARDEGEAMRLWTSYADGPVAMEAVVEW
jgi:3-methylfumaryl-CoA hydratase